MIAPSGQRCNPADGRRLSSSQRAHMRLTSDQVIAVTRDEFEQRMHDWRDAENAAAQAEERVRSVGQAAADPRMAQLLQQARELRAKADGELAAIVASLKTAVENNRR
ncbi:MAG TPA: hypothetical protein VGF26_18430 [Ramlibacter sp.]